MNKKTFCRGAPFSSKGPIYVIEATVGSKSILNFKLPEFTTLVYSGFNGNCATACVFTSFLSAAKTVAVLANSFATLRGAESFWWSSILVILITVHVILTVFNFPPNNFVHICGHRRRSNASTVDCTGCRIFSNCISPPIHINFYRLHTRCL
jgi:hypothetical protein